MRWDIICGLDLLLREKNPQKKKIPSADPARVHNIIMLFQGEMKKWKLRSFHLTLPAALATDKWPRRGPCLARERIEVSTPWKFQFKPAFLRCQVIVALVVPSWLSEKKKSGPPEVPAPRYRILAFEISNLKTGDVTGCRFKSNNRTVALREGRGGSIGAHSSRSKLSSSPARVMPDVKTMPRLFQAPRFMK